MMNIIALAELAPDFERAFATFQRVKAVAAAYAAKVHAVLPPPAKPQQNTDVGAILDAVAVFTPELKPLIPDLLAAIATIEKAQAIIDAPAEPPTGWPQ